MQLEQQSGIGSLTVFHSFGRQGGMLCQLRRGAAVKLLQAISNPSNLLDLPRLFSHKPVTLKKPPQSSQQLDLMVVQDKCLQERHGSSNLV